MNGRAKKCLNWISEKLSSDEWKNRLETPSEFDATLYAYIAIILKQTLPNSQLQSHAKQCDNLQKFADGITKKYFKPSERFETPKPNQKRDSTVKSEEEKVYTGVQEDDDPKDIKKRYILSGLFAISAMSFYAVFAGIFKV